MINTALFVHKLFSSAHHNQNFFFSELIRPKQLDWSALALYSFTPTGKFQIPLTPGDEIKIQEQYDGWYKGVTSSFIIRAS